MAAESEAIELFYGRCISKKTKLIYRRVVEEFINFAGGCNLSQITTDHVISWRDRLLDKNKASTVCFKLTVLWSLFKYLTITGHVRDNPADRNLVARPPMAPAMAGRALTSKEVRSLLAGPDQSRVEGARDYVLLLLMLRLGLRVSEVCALRASSFHLLGDCRVIKYRAKWYNDRTVPVPDDVWKAINVYLMLDKERRDNMNSGVEDPYIFQPYLKCHRPHHKPLSTRAAYNIVRNWAKLTGIGHISPHDLRRTAITRALNKGFNYYEVQMLSGHSSPMTVIRYDYGSDSLERNPVNTLEYDSDDGCNAGSGQTAREGKAPVKSSIYVRWKRRRLKRLDAEGREGGYVRYAVVVRAMRVGGEPRQKVMCYLGHIRESHIAKVGFQVCFWASVRHKLKGLNLDSETHDKIIIKLSTDIPIPTNKQLSTLRSRYLLGM